MKPLVAIVGRPNVGKSVLFNRLVGRRKAIVLGEPGVTRDLNYADVTELARTFTLVDTGGFEPEAKEGLLKQIREQARFAIEEADVIVLLMDGRAGPTHQDKELISILRKAGRPVIYCVNKIDTPRQTRAVDEFYSLGLDSVMPISAEHGLGVAELLDSIFERIPLVPAEEEHDERVKIAIVGRPNVGKSSLLNSLLGRERAIVSEVPGTTRDALDSLFEREGKRYLVIDTAGIRRKTKVSSMVEKYSIVKAIRSINRCDVALLVIDGVEGVLAQDERIGRIIDEGGKGCVIVVNKWDLVEKDTHTARRCSEEVRRRLNFLSFAPVVFVSALTGQRVDKALTTVDWVAARIQARVPTSKLNALLKGFSAAHAPPPYHGRAVKFYYTTQTATGPPTFVVFANYPEGVPETYRRYLVGRFRESLGMKDVPIRVFFRKRE
jgi:GTP-binding protein